MNDDMMAMPRPLPDTTNISTNSLFRLKYWLTMSVEQSRVIPTPIPITMAATRSWMDYEMDHNWMLKNVLYVP